MNLYGTITERYVTDIANNLTLSSILEKKTSRFFTVTVLFAQRKTVVPQKGN
jgi:hypothetical protein